MTSRAVTEKRIWIDKKQYRLSEGKVRFFLASQQPGKVAIGEYTDETNPYSSSVTWNNFRRGIGVQIMDTKRPEHLDRAWYSTAQLRYHAQVVAGKLATVLTQAADGDISVLMDFQSEVYVNHTLTVYNYSNSLGSWSNVRTLLHAPTDWDVGLVGSTEMLVVATGTEVDYATASTTWARNTGQAIKYVVFWNDLLWGITNAGQLYYTDDLTTTWSADALLQLPPGYISKLLVARGPDRETHIYASTKVGLYVHNPDSKTFESTDFSKIPYHPQGGQGAEVWRGNIEYPAGNGVYAFQAGADRTQVTPFGPDKDHGLPESRRGTIVQLEGSHNELLAALDASTGSGTSNLNTQASAGMGSSRMGTFNVHVGYSLILGWDEQGWQVLWQSSSSARAINALLVSNAYSQYRLWWAANRYVYYMQLPVEVSNPLQVSSTTYATSSVLETPWFNGGSPNQTKRAYSVVIESTNPTISETLTVECAYDNVETYETCGVAKTTGEHRFYFGTNRGDGREFRSIKFRVTWARGSTTTNTATMQLLSLNYRKSIRTLYGIEAILDLSGEVNGVPPKDQIMNLRATANRSVEITTRDNDTGDENYRMEPIDISSVESTAHDYSSLVQFRAVEADQSTDR